MLFWFFIMLFVGILIWGYTTRNNEAKVRLSIATFGYDIILHNLQLGHKSFSVLVDFVGKGTIMKIRGLFGHLRVVRVP